MKRQYFVQSGKMVFVIVVDLLTSHVRGITIPNFTCSTKYI